MATMAGMAYCNSNFPTGCVPNCSVASLLSMMQIYKIIFGFTLFIKMKCNENMMNHGVNRFLFAFSGLKLAVSLTAKEAWQEICYNAFSVM